MKKKTTQRKDIQAEVTAKIIEGLENGIKPWECPWTKTGVNSMPINFSTQNEYSGINVLLLWMEAANKGYSSNKWLTYKQAQALGGNVRKGEKSVSCIFVKPLEIEDRERSNDDEKHTKNIMVLNSFSLFNLNQIDGLSLDEEDKDAITYDIDETVNIVESMKKEYCANTGVTVTTGGDRAYYSPVRDLVNVPTTFKTSAGYAATLIHELIHSTGHKTRLDRFKESKASSLKFNDEYAKEEIITELASCFVCSELGINSDHDNHVSYLNSWLTALKEDKTFIFKAASAASKAHSFLLDNSIRKQMAA